MDVYEASERFREIGAGVMVWSRTWHILSEMGLASQFSKAAHAPPDGSIGIFSPNVFVTRRRTKLWVGLGVGFDYRKSDQPEVGSRFYLYEVPCTSLGHPEPARI